MGVWGFAQKVRPSLATAAHFGVAAEQLGSPGGSLGKGDLGRLEGTLQGLIGYLFSVSEEFHNLVEYAGKSIAAPSDSQEDSACTLAVCPALKIRHAGVPLPLGGRPCQTLR
jgi:hypothetical protein